MHGRRRRHWPGGERLAGLGDVMPGDDVRPAGGDGISRRQRGRGHGAAAGVAGGHQCGDAGCVPLAGLADDREPGGRPGGDRRRALDGNELRAGRLDGAVRLRVGTRGRADRLRACRGAGRTGRAAHGGGADRRGLHGGGRAVGVPDRVCLAERDAGQRAGAGRAGDARSARGRTSPRFAWSPSPGRRVRFSRRFCIDGPETWRMRIAGRCRSGGGCSTAC